MWKWIQKLASPQVFYETTNKLIPWFFWPFIALIILGLYWGLVLAPADYQQGEKFSNYFTSMFPVLGCLCWSILLWQLLAVSV